MILVVSGTNKQNSYTNVITNLYFNALQEAGADVSYFSLEGINGNFISDSMYDDKPDEIISIQNKFFLPADKFVFIIPEYNGSFPGILKLVLDTMDVRSTFAGKRAAIVGVATGRAGNLRGIDHLTSVLHHMQVTVMPRFLPISSVKNELNENGELKNPKTIEAFQKHVDALVKF